MNSFKYFPDERVPLENLVRDFLRENGRHSHEAISKEGDRKPNDYETYTKENGPRHYQGTAKTEEQLVAHLSHDNC